MTDGEGPQRSSRRLGGEDRFLGTDTSGGLGRSWWSGRWLRALSNWLSTSMLATGRLYVRRGQVTDLSVQVGTVTARVHEPDGTVCAVRLGMTTFSDDVWDRVIRMVAGSISYSAHLLNGDVPRDVEDLFRSAGVGLFPERRAEVDAECDCPEWSAACNHVAAVLVLLGDQMDEDPFLLLRLRGRAHEQVMASLRAVRAMLAQSPDAASGGRGPATGAGSEESLEARLADFWEMGAELDGMQIRVRPPEVDLEVIKLLGVPTFANDAELMDRLARVYRLVSRRAMDVAYRASADEAPDENDNGSVSPS